MVVFGREHPYGRPATGLPSTVEKVPRDDLVASHRARLTPGGAARLPRGSGTLAGCDGGWMPHLTGRPGLGTLLRFHRAETALGAALLGLCALGRVDLWLLPVAGSLCLTSLVSWLVQRDIRSGWLLRPMGRSR